MDLESLKANVDTLWKTYNDASKPKATKASRVFLQMSSTLEFKSNVSWIERFFQKSRFNFRSNIQVMNAMLENGWKNRASLGTKDLEHLRDLQKAQNKLVDRYNSNKSRPGIVDRVLQCFGVKYKPKMAEKIQHDWAPDIARSQLKDARKSLQKEVEGFKEKIDAMKNTTTCSEEFVDASAQLDLFLAGIQMNIDQSIGELTRQWGEIKEIFEMEKRGDELNAISGAYNRGIEKPKGPVTRSMTKAQKEASSVDPKMQRLWTLETEVRRLLGQSKEKKDDKLKQLLNEVTELGLKTPDDPTFVTVLTQLENMCKEVKKNLRVGMSSQDI